MRPELRLDPVEGAYSQTFYILDLAEGKKGRGREKRGKRETGGGERREGKERNGRTPKEAKILVMALVSVEVYEWSRLGRDGV